MKFAILGFIIGICIGIPCIIIGCNPNIGKCVNNELFSGYIKSYHIEKNSCCKGYIKRYCVEYYDCYNSFAVLTTNNNVSCLIMVDNNNSNNISALIDAENKYTYNKKLTLYYNSDINRCYNDSKLLSVWYCGLISLSFAGGNLIIIIYYCIKYYYKTQYYNYDMNSIEVIDFYTEEHL